MTPTPNEALAARLRLACSHVRLKSMPLSEFIPLLQQAADALASSGQAASAVPLEWKKAVQEAYGWLWHVNNEPMAPVPMWSSEQAAYEARKNLRDLLTMEQRGEAINAVRGLLENKSLATPAAPAQPREAQAGEPLDPNNPTEAQKQECVAAALAWARKMNLGTEGIDEGLMGFDAGVKWGVQKAQRSTASVRQHGLAEGLHPATADLVSRFAWALSDKLRSAEKKYGYSDGWLSPDWMDECRQHLREHIEKGDPRDVAAYCAFLWHHGASTANPGPKVPTDEALLALVPWEIDTSDATEEAIDRRLVLKFARSVLSLSTPPAPRAPSIEESATFTPWDSLPWKPKPIGFARRSDIEQYEKVLTIRPPDAEHEVALFTRDQLQRAVSAALKEFEGMHWVDLDSPPAPRAPSIEPVAQEQAGLPAILKKPYMHNHKMTEKESAFADGWNALRKRLIDEGYTAPAPSQAQAAEPRRLKAWSCNSAGDRANGRGGPGRCVEHCGKQECASATVLTDPGHIDNIEVLVDNLMLSSRTLGEAIGTNRLAFNKTDSHIQRAELRANADKRSLMNVIKGFVL